MRNRQSTTPASQQRTAYAAAMKCSTVLALTLLAACGGGQKEVAVQGSDKDLVNIAGDWQGEYKGTESGRSGPVSFSLQVGSHIAEGQVLMGGATPLKIEFIKAKSGQIQGTIAPYTDPNCSCQVETTFLGTVREGNSIDGTFETKLGTTGQVQTGTWEVARKQK
jgi:hypothetical protein